MINSINGDLAVIGGSFVAVCNIWPSFNAPFVWNGNVWLELLNIISHSTKLITTFAYCAILKFIVVDDIVLLRKLRSEINLKINYFAVPRILR